QRLTGAEYVLMQLNQEIARARKPSAWRSRMELVWDSEPYELLRPSIWRRTHVLRGATGDVVTITPVNAFSRRATVDADPDLPLLLVVVFVVLVIISWNRDQAAAASGGGA